MDLLACSQVIRSVASKIRKWMTQSVSDKKHKTVQKTKKQLDNGCQQRKVKILLDQFPLQILLH